ncbi:unnamed protein product [Lactuca virosa]|uniref:Uncharacterized protein n=1 Tax=Lactuca virosa TaxID=75947 RepID=A0AAU9NTZ5_9ASTR|nr:unnamed protein product [Lactuca virosa]
MIMTPSKKYARLIIPWEGTKQKLEQEEKEKQHRQIRYSLLMKEVRHVDPEDQEAAKAVKESIHEKYKLNSKWNFDVR